MSGKPFLTLCGLLLVLVLSLSSTACSLVQSAQEFSQTGNDFMTALKDAEYETALSLCESSLQARAGSAGDLKKMIEDNQAQPKEWTFASWNLSTNADQNQIAKVEGSVTYQDGRQGGVTLELIKAGENWKLLSFNFTW